MNILIFNTIDINNGIFYIIFMLNSVDMIYNDLKKILCEDYESHNDFYIQMFLKKEFNNFQIMCYLDLDGNEKVIESYEDIRYITKLTKIDKNFDKNIIENLYNKCMIIYKKEQINIRISKMENDFYDI